MKKLFTLLLAAFLLMTLTGCDKAASIPDLSIPGLEEPEDEASVSGSEASTEEDVSGEEEGPEVQEEPAPAPVVEVSPNYDGHSDSELFIIYASAIRDVFNTVFFGLTPVDDNLLSMMTDAMYMSDLEEKAKVGFCYYDIDKNGTKELVVGMEDIVFAIYGYDENESPVSILGAGYRSTLDIYENGVIAYGGSSGAASYSIANYTLDGKGGKELIDFYFTEADGDGNLVFYKNTTGIWDAEISETITEEEFGGEYESAKVDFSKDWISLEKLSKKFGGTESGVLLEDVTNITWVLDSYEENGELFDAEELGIDQTLIIKDNGTADYHCEKNGEVVVDKKGAQYFYYDYSKSLDIYFDNAGDGNNYTVTLIRIDPKGMLVVQKLYYAADKHGVTYEYYKKSDQ